MGLLLSEKQLQSQIVQYAKLRGWRVYHTYDSRRSTAGFPDLVLVRDNHLIFAEIKSNRGKVTPEQRSWIEALTRTQCEIHVWRPDDWDYIETLLA